MTSTSCKNFSTLSDKQLEGLLSVVFRSIKTSYQVKRM
jgi:hypothetical protein